MSPFWGSVEVIKCFLRDKKLGTPSHLGQISSWEFGNPKKFGQHSKDASHGIGTSPFAKEQG